MTGLAILVPLALLMGLAGLAGFLWALGNGQFDDPDGSAMRMLIDDDGPALRDVPRPPEGGRR